MDPSPGLSQVALEPARGWRFDVAPGQTLLAAALAHGLPWPASCRNGTCRTCRCRVLTGKVRHLIAWPGLLAEEKAEGWILPCVAEPLTPVTLALPSLPP